MCVYMGMYVRMCTRARVCVCACVRVCECISMCVEAVTHMLCVHVMRIQLCTSYFQNESN